MTHLDWSIIVIYLLAVVGLGVAAGFLRRKGETGGEGGHYFLAGNTLAWPVIGLAMFAANISTVHLVSLAERSRNRSQPDTHVTQRDIRDIACVYDLAVEVIRDCFRSEFAAPYVKVRR